MNVSSLQELKQELQELPPKKLLELCLGMAKYRKDNKEYLSYLLFQSHDRQGYLAQVKAETDIHFEELKAQTNLYYIKKGLRRILRILNKYCKYMNNKATTVELLIYFCRKIKEAGIPVHDSARLTNLLAAQIKKIKSLIASLHEDLQVDYLRELDSIVILL